MATPILPSYIGLGHIGTLKLSYEYNGGPTFGLLRSPKCLDYLILALPHGGKAHGSLVATPPIFSTTSCWHTHGENQVLAWPIGIRSLLSKSIERLFGGKGVQA